MGPKSILLIQFNFDLCVTGQSVKPSQIDSAQGKFIQALPMDKPINSFHKLLRFTPKVLNIFGLDYKKNNFWSICF